MINSTLLKLTLLSSSYYLENKKASHNWDEIFKNHTSGKVFSEYTNNSENFLRKKTTQLKFGKSLKQKFYQRRHTNGK